MTPEKSTGKNQKLTIHLYDARGGGEELSVREGGIMVTESDNLRFI